MPVYKSLIANKSTYYAVPMETMPSLIKSLDPMIQKSDLSSQDVR